MLEKDRWERLTPFKEDFLYKKSVISRKCISCEREPCSSPCDSSMIQDAVASRRKMMSQLFKNSLYSVK